MKTDNEQAAGRIEHPQHAADALRVFSGRLEVFAALSRASLEAHWYAQQQGTTPDPDLVLPEPLALGLRELADDFEETQDHVTAWFAKFHPASVGK